MKPTPGTLDHYREKGKSDPDITALVAMIDRIQAQLTTALEAVAKLSGNNP